MHRILAGLGVSFGTSKDYALTYGHMDFMNEDSAIRAIELTNGATLFGLKVTSGWASDTRRMLGLSEEKVKI
jgi:hypothetical protein